MTAAEMLRDLIEKVELLPEGSREQELFIFQKLPAITAQAVTEIRSMSLAEAEWAGVYLTHFENAQCG